MSRPDNEAEQKDGYGERLKEITAVLKKHSITRGVSPEKLRLILEDLGPNLYQVGSAYVTSFRYPSQALLR